MAATFTQAQSRLVPKSDHSAVIGLVLMALALFAGLSFLLMNSDAPAGFPYLFLLPWIFALAVVLLVPPVVLYFQGKFSPANPIVFATFSYFLPAFVIGGFVLSIGWSQPYFLSFIEDAHYNLPYTIVIVMLGFAGLSVGYFLPLGARIGSMIESWLPRTQHSLTAYIVPGFILLSLGIVTSTIAFTLGVIGYQKAAEINSYDGLIFLMTVFWGQASFVLWYVVFQRKKFDLLAFVIIVPLLVTALSKALYAGNRGILLGLFVLVVLAYTLSGRKLKFKQSSFAAIILLLCLSLGFVYGTTFRSVKGTESRQDIGIYTENIVETIDKVGNANSLTTMEFGLQSLVERLEIVSSLAVVVSNYEALQPYEESFGLDNNIWKDTVTFLVPRIIWNEKPLASDTRKYSALYFNYGENSFAITPMGDLLRNFGVPGVPIGMLVLGILLRTTYRVLVEDQPRMLWRSTLYFIILVSVSYEGFYGTIIPYVFKVGLVSVVGILFLNFVAKRMVTQTTYD